MYQTNKQTEELKKAYPHLLEPIKLKPAPPGLTIPEIQVGPRPECPKCGERMILKRPWHDERFYREYWKCYTKKCMTKIQIDDDGYPIIEQKGETDGKRTEPEANTTGQRESKIGATQTKLDI